MFSKKAKEKTELDKAIDSVLEEMSALTADSEEYAKDVKQLAELYKIRAGERREQVSINTVLSVGGSLLGIGMIILFERNNVVTSKALSFIIKPKA